MADNKNMTQEEIDNGEEMTVTLTLDDGREIECVVLTVFSQSSIQFNTTIR